MYQYAKVNVCHPSPQAMAKLKSCEDGSTFPILIISASLLAGLCFMMTLLIPFYKHAPLPPWVENMLVSTDVENVSSGTVPKVLVGLNTR